jgi:hypothetical protein
MAVFEFQSQLLPKHESDVLLWVPLNQEYEEDAKQNSPRDLG